MMRKDGEEGMGWDGIGWYAMGMKGWDGDG